MSLTTTWAPSAPKRMASAAPMPLPAPVTTTPAPGRSAASTPWSSAQWPARHIDHLTGHEARPLAREERDGVRDVLRHPDPPHRGPRRSLLLEFGEVHVQPRRGRAGLHGDQDAGGGRGDSEAEEA